MEEKLICPNQFHFLLSCLNLTSLFFRLQSVKQANWLVINSQCGGEGGRIYGIKCYKIHRMYSCRRLWKYNTHIHTYYYCFIFPAETSVDGHKLPTQYASLASSENSSIDDISETSPVPASLFAQFFLLYYRNIIVLCRNYVSKQCVCACACAVLCCVVLCCVVLCCAVLCYNCRIRKPRPMAENLLYPPCTGFFLKDWYISHCSGPFVILIQITLFHYWKNKVRIFVDTLWLENCFK